MATDSYNFLLQGKIFEAINNFYMLAFNGWFWFMLICVFEIVLLIKTKSATITFTTCSIILLFISGLANATQFFAPKHIYVFYIMLAINLTGLLYCWIAK